MINNKKETLIHPHYVYNTVPSGVYFGYIENHHVTFQVGNSKENLIIDKPESLQDISNVDCRVIIDDEGVLVSLVH